MVCRRVEHAACLSQGDLIVMYRTRPASAIHDLWRVQGPFEVDKEWGLLAGLKLLVRLTRPLGLVVGPTTTRA